MNSKKLLDEYRERFKEQMKYQRLLIDATKIFSETNEIELFRKLHELCKNSISCEAIAWFSDSRKLLPAIHRIYGQLRSKRKNTKGIFAFCAQEVTQVLAEQIQRRTV